MRQGSGGKGDRGGTREGHWLSRQRVAHPGARSLPLPAARWRACVTCPVKRQGRHAALRRLSLQRRAFAPYLGQFSASLCGFAHSAGRNSLASRMRSWISHSHPARRTQAIPPRVVGSPPQLASPPSADVHGLPRDSFVHGHVHPRRRIPFVPAPYLPFPVSSDSVAEAEPSAHPIGRGEPLAHPSPICTCLADHR